MSGQALNCKRTALATGLLTLVATSGVSIAAHAQDLPRAEANGETIIMFPPPPPSWGLDIGFVENGPRTGVELQINAPQFGGAWVPQFGFGGRSIDIEGHLNSASTTSSEVHSAGFVYVSAKFQNTFRHGMVRPYGMLKLGALLMSDVANAKACGAGYIGIGGEFPFSELVRGIFNGNVYERSMSFFVETGAPVTGPETQATRMRGAPFIFNGISTTIGFKYSL